MLEGSDTIDSIVRPLSGHIEDGSEDSPEQQLEDYTAGRMGRFTGAVTALTILFVPPAIWMAPEGASLVQLVQPFLLSPIFALAGLALFVPIQARAFGGLGLAVAILPALMLALGVAPMTLRDACIYELYALPVVLLGALACRTHREYFLRQCETDRVRQRLTAELDETKAALAEAQQHLVSADRTALLGVLAGGVSSELEAPLRSVREHLAELDSGHASDSGFVIASLQLGQALEYLEALSQQKRNLGWSNDRKFDVVFEVMNAVTLLKWKAAEAGLVVQVEGNHGLQVKGDPGKLVQVMSTLLEFAIRRAAGMPNADTIDIAVSIAEQGLTIQVSDPGPPIPKSVADQLFEPNGTRSPDDAGTGLELSICRTIVEGNLGGKLHVEPPKNHGATLTIVLPVSP